MLKTFLASSLLLFCKFIYCIENGKHNEPDKFASIFDNKPKANSEMFMGVCYDAMHNQEYPIHGGTPDSAALGRAIDRDFSLISEYFKHVRTFYSTFFDVPVAPYAAKYGVQLYLGVFMTDESWYQSQVDAAVDAVKKYPGTVLAILVGNENLRPNGPYSADDIIARVKQIRAVVKQSTNQDVQVGTVQRITEWLNPEISSETSRLADACDIIGVNIYPFFGYYDYQNPIQPLDEQWNTMIYRYGEAKVRLTETGFPSAGGRSPSGVEADLNTEISYYYSVANWQPIGYGPAFWFQFHDRRPDDNSVPGEFEKYFGLFTADSMPKADNFPPRRSSYRIASNLENSKSPYYPYSLERKFAEVFKSSKIIDLIFRDRWIEKFKKNFH